ncbi:Uncharacterized protein Fot_26674 [Forsythia ovata]|uniref:Uncharacterized protein n=1 Tax=Forsythia ovata TaxID=205694 RepID=A0ABD1UCI8_9LAMI
MITTVIAGLKERSSRRVEGTVNIPFDLNSAGSRRRHGRPPKRQPEPVQNDVLAFVHGVQNSMATVPREMGLAQYVTCQCLWEINKGSRFVVILTFCSSGKAFRSSLLIAMSTCFRETKHLPEKEN